MKMKLLLFMGLLAGSIGFSLLGSATTYAVGESYKWIDANTIEGSGGSFTQTTGIVKDGPSGPSKPVPVQTVRFTRDGNTTTFKAPTTGIYYGSAGGGTGSFSTKCDLQLSITVSALNGGSIATNEPGKTNCANTGLTKALTIADTDKGPTAESLGVGTTVTTGPGAPIGATADSDEPDSTGCNIEAIGWIICPVVRFMAKIVDGAYAFVSSLLEIQPLTATNGAANESIYGAWSVMRNFANVAFVIAFMFIIYSQLTSFGLNNYGVKKMLPRLIVAAILVNVSFWICALAVDISNILGASLNGLFKSIPVAGTETASFQVNDPSVTGTGWQGLVGGIVASTVLIGAVLYVTLSALVPAILAAFIAIITVFLVLSIRQALVILLIVVSPLAFVAYLLPNTESLYKKWLGLFKTMLLMYPAIALLFGASALASKIVMNSATGTYALAIQIMGALISIVPLALTPIVMKTAGGVLNRIGGYINNPNKGPIDRLRKGARSYAEEGQNLARGNRLSRASKLLDGNGKLLGKSYSKRRRAAALLGSFGATNAIDSEKRKGFAKAVAEESGQEYFAKRSLGEEGFAERIAGDDKKAQGLKASAQSAVDKIESDSVKNREVLLRAKFDPRELQTEAGKALDTAIKKGDTTGARAAQNILLTSGSPGLAKLSETLQAAEASNTLGEEVSASLRKDLNSAGLKGRDNTLAKWSYSNDNLKSIISDANTYAGLSDKELIGQSDTNLAMAVRSGAISQARADALLKSDALGTDFTAQKRAIIASVASAPQANQAAAQTPQTPPRPQNPPTVQNQPQAPQPQPQQPGVLNIPHNANPGNARMSPPPNSGSATILNPNNRNNNNP